MISTFFFDMDGVLFDTETEVAQILKNDCADRFGYHFSDDLLNRCLGRSYNDCRKLYLDEFGEGFPFTEVWSYCAQRIREKADNGTLTQKPGVRPLLSMLQENKIPCILVTSNGSRQARFLLERSGLFPFFQEIIGGESVAEGKPAPDIYLKALERTGADPKKTIVIEDSVQGVSAALSAGLSVVMVPDRVKPDAEMQKACTACVSSLSDVLPALKEKGLWS